jgi:hypothetical protein
MRFAAVVAGVMAALAAVGYFAAGDVVGRVSVKPGESGNWSAVLGSILGTNSLAALGLVAGVVTCGLTTVGSAFVLSIYFGTVVRVGVETLPGNPAIALAFCPIEFAAMVCATVAGLMPVSAVVRRVRAGDPFRVALTSYLPGVRSAVPWILLCFLLLLVAAALETATGAKLPH